MKRKLCKHCRKTLDVAKFDKNKRKNDGLQTYCKKCQYKLNQEWLLKTGYNWKGNRLYQKQYAQKIKIIVFKHYSHGKLKCKLCGYDTVDALTIDHINGGGLKHRKTIGYGGTNFYRWLIKNNFPEGYRVLCRNCNWLEKLRIDELTKK